MHLLGQCSLQIYRAGATSATTIDQHLIYNTDDGALYYDPDGVDGAAATLIAHVYDGTGFAALLSSTDFTVI